MTIDKTLSLIIGNYKITSLLAMSMLITAPSLADTDYRAEFFSWAWMPCMYQLAEDNGANITNIDNAALEIHSKLEGENFNKQAWETEKVVRELPPEERAEVYEYLRNECAGGYVASEYLPKWEVGKAPF